MVDGRCLGAWVSGRICTGDADSTICDPGADDVDAQLALESACEL